MGIHFFTALGTGRATCRLCLKKIEKNVPCVKAFGYRTAGQIHLRPDDCIIIRKRLRERNWRARMGNG